MAVLVLSSTHSRLPFFLLAAQGLRQLQVAPGGNVQLHELALVIVVQCVNVGQVALLRVVQEPRRLPSVSITAGFSRGSCEAPAPRTGMPPAPGRSLLLRLTHPPGGRRLLLRQHPPRRVLGGLFVQDDLRRENRATSLRRCTAASGAGKRLWRGSFRWRCRRRQSLPCPPPATRRRRSCCADLQRGITQHCARGHPPG